MRRAALKFVSGAALICGLSACNGEDVIQNCEVEFIILGTAQDAGSPQIGNNDDPAWKDRFLKSHATSAALVNHQSGARYLFEATPDMREQLYTLDMLAPPKTDVALGISGIFLTHAHIGHYAGLMFLGHESAGTKDLPVYAMPRMAGYLTQNGPWSQLVDFGNISLQPLSASKAAELGGSLSVTPYQVPHRDEFSETVGFEIASSHKAVLFLPDIDSWDEWENYGQTIETRLAEVDYAFLDATFYDDKELPGRDMSAIPHPRLKDSMDRFDKLPKLERDKVRFIHLNHTNPARFENSDISKEIARRGYKLAKAGQRYCLD
ncbi:MBL fold metallo-hydrolase [Hellea balneolensis]|uniref:MBL fold metallo-hydrolase n=1 Tax=Hellea balneolensis TaxID=287478 RepID=UPI0004104D8C|nr:MBL fold metallo-hydrolase [Hellea balneolensis]